MKEARLKAILDTLETEYKNIGLSYYPEDLFAPNDPKIIYDYIINLQSQLKAKEETEKEFIKYLEEKIEHNTPRVRWKHYNEDGFNDYDVENGDYLEAQPVNITLKEVISKYKEILSKGENK